MEDLGILGVIAVVSFFSTEVIKNILHIFFKKVKIGIIISVIINFLFVISLGYGMIYYLTGVDYNSVDIPSLFKYTDILTSAFLLTVVSKFANATLEKKGINISGMVQSVSDQSKEITDEEVEAITATVKKFKNKNESTEEVAEDASVEETKQETKDKV